VETIRVRKLSHSDLHIESDSGAAQELNEFFSFFVPGYKFMPAFRNRMWDGKIRLFQLRDRTLPAGLFYHLSEFCKNRGYILESEKTQYGAPDDRNHITPDSLNSLIQSLNLPFDLRPYQYECVGEALTRKRAILLSPTGSGKSFIIYVILSYYLAHLAKTSDTRVLVIVPTTSLVEQMAADFQSYGLPEGLAHKIYSGKDKNTNSPIVISTWQSIYKLPKAWFEQFGAVFGDEVHGFKSKSLMNIMNKCTEAEYRFGTTGTLDGSQTHELVLQGLFGKIYKVTTTKKLQDSDTLAKLSIRRLVLEYNEKVRKDFGKQTYQDEIAFIVEHEKRNNFIKNLTLDLKGNTLVLYNYVEKHGKPLFNLIRDNADENRKIFFVSGGTDVSDREAIRGIVEKQSDAIVVASLGTFSTGINIKNLHNIVFASPSKSQIRVLQSIGRGLRKSDDGRVTTLYDISDDISWQKRKNFSLLHSWARLDIYKKEQFEYQTITVKI
jgi:superfamily II DNA or RNA helicase